MSDNAFPIRAPDPVAVAQLAGLFRHALTFGGGALSAFGVSMPAWLAGMSDPEITVIVSAGMFFGGCAATVLGLLMSRWDKWRTRQREVAGSVASAEGGVPVTVTVTPVGVPNEAVRISATEARAAPSVPAGVSPSPAPRAA